METPYSKAWNKFQKSETFEKQLAIMKEAEPRTKNVYLKNRIQEIFDAAWSAGLKHNGKS